MLFKSLTRHRQRTGGQKPAGRPLFRCRHTQLLEWAVIGGRFPARH